MKMNIDYGMQPEGYGYPTLTEKGSSPYLNFFGTQNATAMTSFPQNPTIPSFPSTPSTTCFPPSYWEMWGPYATTVNNLPAANVGSTGRPWQNQDLKGYSIDLNNDGGYQAGTDAVLAFDFTHDGRLDPGEVEVSRRMLRAFKSDFDFNSDGRIEFWEDLEGQKYLKAMNSLDRNKNGKLDAQELSSVNARIAVDKNKDGTFDRNELYSVYSFPTPWFGRGSIEYIDTNSKQTKIQTWAWRQPYFGFA